LLRYPHRGPHGPLFLCLNRSTPYYISYA
jgi:hypothetical protein